MRLQNACGLIFPHLHDDMLHELTEVRALGSIPFAGRYRLVDFPLSHLVHAGCSHVGVVTTKKYLSLALHLGSGKEWDLSRKSDGLCLLPALDISPEEYEGRLAPLHGIREWLELCPEEYVVMSDCYAVGPVDYSALVEAHRRSGATITVAYKRGACPALPDVLTLEADAAGVISRVSLGARPEGEAAYGIGLYVLSRRRLIELVEDAYSRGKSSFERDVLQPMAGSGELFAYEVSSFTMVMAGVQDYYDANMALLDPAVLHRLFPADHPVYTHVHNCAPAIYGLNSRMTDSLIADGTFVDGTVTHSVLARNVRIEAGATVRGCIIMQGSVVETGAVLENVILDKDVIVSRDRVLRGAATYPVYVGKGRHI